MDDNVMMNNSLLVNREKRIKKRADISRLVNDCMGDQVYVNEMFSLLKENMKEFYNATAVFLKAKDRFSISRAAHKIKNGLELIQACSLLDYVDMIQNECQHVDTIKNIEKLIADSKTEYNCVVQELEEQIAMLDAK
ncbi:hypothetical protein OOZ15_15590 [Galbibacter sp. EGI 63066]|uniref:hypothetical protein n=1 Tax=Galbibacter sp. EGI 63066 TaxID=2993559 RepID=UPI00224956EB|nr:hypothetical protein [Galbibacter sp. EGI 63066]MCX2681376.1 hypothetical protein [Galbibacter sp. EGI 63066]